MTLHLPLGPDVQLQSPPDLLTSCLAPSHRWMSLPEAQVPAGRELSQPLCSDSHTNLF